MNTPPHTPPPSPRNENPSQPGGKSPPKKRRSPRGAQLLKTATLAFLPAACLKLLPELPAADGPPEAIAKWCLRMYERLVTAQVRPNDIVLFCNWIAMFQDGKIEHTGTPFEALLGKTGPLHRYSNTLLAVHLFRTEFPKRKSFQSLLRCAFGDFHDVDIPYQVTQQATGFLCAALNLSPAMLLEAINTLSLRQLSDDAVDRKRIPLADREQLYCVVSYLEILPDAENLDDLAACAEGHWHQLGTTFVARAEAVSLMILPPWQSRIRKLRFEYAMDEAMLQRHVKELKQDADRAQLIVLNSIFGKVKFAGDNDSPTADDAQAFVQKIQNYLQYAAERGIDSSGEALFVWARSQGYSSRKQLAVIHAALGQDGLAAAMREELDQLEKFILANGADNKAALLERIGGRALELPLPVRWAVGFLRGGAAQLLGRGIVAGVLTTMAFPTIASYGPGGAVGVVVALTVADACLKSLAGGYLFAGPATAQNDPDNFRRISTVLTAVTVAAAVAQPVIALACVGWREESIERDDVNEGLMHTIHSFGGPGAYLATQLIAATFARVMRQSVQTASTSNFSAGIAVAYHSGDPLSENDRESVNALRDVLYLGTTALLLGGVPYFGALSPTASQWLPVALTCINEGIDEVNPDAAVLVARFWRDRNPQFAESDARYTFTNASTPSIFDASSKGFLKHFMSHSASRITHFGLSDLFSMFGDIALIERDKTAYLTFKALSAVLSALFGGRRGAMTSYQVEGGRSLPSGLLSWCLRNFFGVRDATGRLQIRPVLEAEVRALEYDKASARYGDRKIRWNWQDCRRFAIDSRVLAVVYPPDQIKTFHQASSTAVNAAAFNMLCMHFYPKEYLLLEPLPKPDQSPTLAELCTAARSRKEVQRLKRKLEPESVRLFQCDFACISFVFGTGDVAAAIGAQDKEVLEWLRSEHAICASFKNPADRAIFIRCHEGLAYLYSPLTNGALDVIDMDGKDGKDGKDIMMVLTRYLKKCDVRQQSTVTIAYAAPIDTGAEDPSSVTIEIPEPLQAPTERMRRAVAPAEKSASASGTPPRPAGLAPIGTTPSKASGQIYREVSKGSHHALPVVNMMCMYISGNEPSCRLAESDLKPSGAKASGKASFADLASAAREKKAPTILAVATIVNVGERWEWMNLPPNLRSLRVMGISLSGKTGKQPATCALLATDKAASQVIHYIDPALEQTQQSEGSNLEDTLLDLLQHGVGRTRCNIIFPVSDGATKALSMRILTLFREAIAHKALIGNLRAAVQAELHELPIEDFLDACSAVFWSFESATEEAVPRVVQQGVFLDAAASMHDGRLVKKLAIGILKNYTGGIEQRWNDCLRIAQKTSDADNLDGRSDSQ